MRGTKPSDISKFFIAGINYRKTDASVRGSFAIGNEQYENILLLAPSYGISELFVLSTCNRTEIYGVAEDAAILIDLLCTQTMGAKKTFTGLAYIKSGREALEHLFNVSAGLDSQILGDYEIVGQIKHSVKVSKKHDFMGGFLERLVNSVLQASKSIKNQTALSDGTVSVSFAAVQYIKETVFNVADKKILLLGTGKIGRTTCRNLVDYLETNNITLINRTQEKAILLAKDVNVQFAPIEELATCIQTSDIILVATNAADPVLLQSQLVNTDDKLIIDLSIPCNVERSAGELPHISLVNVDELSKLKDKTLQKRVAEIPRARAIIAEQLSAFLEWFEMRKHVPVLRAVKTKLKEIHERPLFVQSLDTDIDVVLASSPDKKIQRVINGMATKMRQHNQRGCHYIEAINEFMAPVIN
jgi:glutamyl-tRNA reductase